LVEAHEGLHFDPALCECSCGEVEDVECGDLALVFADECEGFVEHLQDVPPTGECMMQEIGDAVAVTPSFTPDLDAASCAPEPGIERAPIEWDATVLACSGVGAGICEDPTESCLPPLPADFESKPCIVRAGDLPCPDPYSDKQKFHSGATDSRGCEDCTCQSPSGVLCDAQVSAHEDEECQDAGLLLTVDECVQVQGIYVKAHDVSWNGGCAPSDPDPVGTVLESEPVTVCCLE
jgi:hypothetical protein